MNIDDILDCHKENRERFEELNELCCNNVIVPFVGAGMSMPPYLGWSDTLRELLGTDDEKNLTKLNKILSEKKYQEAADFVYEVLHAGLFEDRFRKHYEKYQGQYSEGTKILPKIFDKTAILTTNYDHCLNKAYDDADVDYAVYYPRNGKYVVEIVEKLLRPTKTIIWKLHGDYEMAESRVFTSKEYNCFYNKNGECIRQLKRYLSITSLLFLGCSLSETDYYVGLLKKITTKSKRIKNYAFLKLPKTDDELSHLTRFCSDLYIFPIWYPNDDYKHESVVILLNHLKQNTIANRTLRRSVTSETFTNKSIPEVIKTELDNLGIDIKIPNSENITLDDVIAIAMAKTSKYSKEGLEHAFFGVLGDAYDDKYKDRKNKDDVRGYKSTISRNSWKVCFNKCLKHIGITKEKYYQSNVIVVGIGNGEEGKDLEYDKIVQNGKLCIVDIALESLQKAYDDLFVDGGKCIKINQPAQNMSSVPSASQDIYISTMTYQSTFFDIDKALYEAIRVLKSDGKIIISVVNGYLNEKGNYVRGLTKFNSKTIDQKKPVRIINHIKEKLKLLGNYSIRTYESDSEIFLCAHIKQKTT